MIRKIGHFLFKNLRQGNTRRHYIAFYTIYYIENVTFAIIYAIYSIETNRIVKYSLVIFVLTGFWLAILFQFFYYRFLHPNTDVRLNAKEQVSSIVHLEPLKRARSSVTLNHDHDSLKTIDQQSVSVEEACHNRFAKENRRTLHCQHRIINKKLKMNTTRKYSVTFPRNKNKHSDSFAVFLLGSNSKSTRLTENVETSFCRTCRNISKQ